MDIASILGVIAGGAVGGISGGTLVAYLKGRLDQRIEDRLAACERRLEKGDPLVEAVRPLEIQVKALIGCMDEQRDRVDKVPVLIERVDSLIKGQAEFKQAFRDFTRDVVTVAACNARHGKPA